MKHKLSSKSTPAVRLALACLAGTVPTVERAYAQEQAGGAGSAKTELVSDGDIYVTAQRREERLVNVPVAVSAIGGNDLKQMNIQRATQLTRVIPNLEITDQSTIPVVSIRGIGLNDFGYANESPIAFYTNDVYFASPLSPLRQFFDVDRIEVLRGPQGTLFGRNATGGLLQIITNKPTADFSGGASIQYGSYDQVIIEGHQNIPLSHAIRTRTAAIFNRDRGWQKSVVSGARFAKTHAWAIRETVDVDISPSIMNSLIGHYGKSNGQNQIITFRGNRDPLTGAFCSDARVVANECVTSDGFRNPDPNPHDVYTPLTKAPNVIETWGIDNTLKYSGDGFSITSITAYESLDASYLGDAAGTPSSIFQDAYAVTRKQFSQEIRADGEFGSLKWIAGGYYFHDKIPYALITAPTLVALFGTTFTLQNEYRQTTDAAAAFGQVDYEIIPRVTLTGGIRYSHEKKTLTITDSFSSPSFPADTYSPKVGVVTWKAGAKWQVRDRLMMYASVATGFKSAAFNTSLVGPGQAKPAKPEKNTNYEIGIKGETSDRRLQGSINAFYTDYREIQTVTIPSGALAAVIYNIPKARIQGLEAEFTARPFSRLSLNGSATLLDTKILSKGILVAGIDVTGNRLGQTPKLGLKGGARYDFEIGSSGTISPSLHVSYHSKAWASATMTPLDFIPSYTLIDAGITWTSPNKQFTVDVLAQNATDKAYYTSAGAYLGLSNVRFGEPRRVSVRLSTHW